MVIMMWKDVNLYGNICVPKWFFCIYACISYIAIFGVSRSMIIHQDLESIIGGIIGIALFSYLGAYNLFIVFKASRYVKFIQENEGHFILTTVFNKQEFFSISDVFSVQFSKSYRLERLLTDFGE